MSNHNDSEHKITELIEEALHSAPPKAVEISSDEIQGLEQSLNIYHSELIYQNEELSRINLELEQSEKKYADLFNFAPVAYVIFDLDGMIQSANASFYRLIGKSKNFILGKKFSGFVAPSSQDAFYFFIRDMNRDLNSRKRLELTLLKETAEISTEMHFNYFKEKETCFIRATIFNVTNQKALMLQLQHEKERYRVIAEQTHDILYEYDIVADTITYSSRYTELTGEEPIVEKFTQTILGGNKLFPEDIPKFKLLLEQVKNQKKNISCDVRIRHAHNVYLWYRIVSTVLTDAGRPVRAVGTITNVESIIRESELLRHAARTDSLTKLYNKEVTRKEIRDYLYKLGRDASHVMFIIDVDNFKYINDHLGHLFGDAVLIEVSNRLQELTRPGDIIGRIGGDEFIILLKNTDAIHARQTADNLCKAIKSILVMERGDCDVSASIGMSCYPEHAKNYEELFRKADIALYGAKRNGKNCFTIYSDDLLQNHSGHELLNCYAAAEPHQERHYTNLLFVTNIIEILFESKNVSSSIMLVLSMLGNYFKVNNVCLVEDCPELDCAKLTYEWYSPGAEEKSGTQVSTVFSRSLLENYGKIFDNDGLFCCYNLDMVKQDNFELWRIADIAGIRTTLECALMDGTNFNGFIALNDFESQRIWQQEDINSFMLIGKTIGAYITKLRTQERNKHFERIDMLTKALNFNSFSTEAEEFLKTSRVRESALLYLDIRNFKYFNDMYGYAEGDAILKEFSSSIQRGLSGDEILGRVSGDQFIVLVNYSEINQLQQRIDKLLTKLSSITKSGTETYRLAVICGVCIIKQSEDKITSLIDRANIARKSVKESHKSTVAYYGGDLEKKILQEKSIEDAMEDALASGEFYVEYQPKVLLKDYSMVGAEALIRWESPVRGKVYPDCFIPIVEKNGFVTELDFFVLDQVCRKMHEWKEQGLPEMVISVNFSRLHVELSDSLVRAETIVDHWDIPHHLLEIEITESAFTENSEILLNFMNKLKDMGFGISMDDFGTGYSSLNLLKDLPIDVLKLDRKFFRSEEVTEKEKIVIYNMARMAQQLGIIIITEGVETQQQAEFLRDIGCEMAQGYLFARPMTVDKMELLLKGEQVNNMLKKNI